jgi:HEAT repeat protein
MRLARVLGLGIVLCGVSLVLAGGVGVPRKEDVPKYLKQLQTAQKASDRAEAAKMLGKRGEVNASDVDDAIEPLKKAVAKDIDSSVRSAAARALGDINPDAAGTVPVLIDRLKDKKEAKDVKVAVAIALGQFGGEAKDALPLLRDFAKEFDAKKSKDGQTIMNSIKLISGAKKKKDA